MITQEILKKNLSYDENTGLFTRLVSNNYRYKIGQVINGKVNYYGYLRIRINGIVYFSHRLAWLYVYGDFPKLQIDHINNIKTDNRIINLREVTSQQNNFNKKVRLDSSTGIKGVSFIKKINKYCVKGTINNKKMHLGHFNDLDSAKNAYMEFSKKYHGSF